MKKEELIAKRINKILGINIFDNLRTTKQVDARSLYCYILRKDLKLTLYEIRDIFRSKGKLFDHSTVYYNVNLYQEVKQRNPAFEILRNEILGKISVKYLLLEQINKIEDEEQLIKISNCVNSYE